MLRFFWLIQSNDDDNMNERGNSLHPHYTAAAAASLESPFEIRIFSSICVFSRSIARALLLCVFLLSVAQSQFNKIKNSAAFLFPFRANVSPRLLCYADSSSGNSIHSLSHVLVVVAVALMLNSCCCFQFPLLAFCFIFLCLN